MRWHASFMHYHDTWGSEGESVVCADDSGEVMDEV